MCLVLVVHLTDRDLKLIAVLQDHDFEIKLFILNLYNMVIFTKKIFSGRCGQLKTVALVRVIIHYGKTQSV